MKNLDIKVERIYRVDTDNDTPLKGFADISIAGSFIIKGLRIIAGKNGLFISMPKDLGKDGKWYSRVSVLNEDLKKELAELILSAFDE